MISCRAAGFPKSIGINKMSLGEPKMFRRRVFVEIDFWDKAYDKLPTKETIEKIVKSVLSRQSYACKVNRIHLCDENTLNEILKEKK